LALATPLIEIRQLSAHFGKRRGGALTKAVDRVDLDVFRGEIFSLVGESGSGKTTLAKLMAGLVEPTRGVVKVDGEAIRHHKRGELRRLWKKVQMVFQDPYSSFNPLSTVVDALKIPLLRYGIAKDPADVRAEIERVLDEVGLSYQEIVGRYPRELSGGQRQRASIARAMLVRPEVLIADEPVSMLDVSLRVGILNLLRELNRRRSLTVVFITHDLASAQYLGGRTAVMYGGQILEIAPTSDLFRSPLNPYTQLLLNATPRLNSSDWLSNEDESRMRAEDAGFTEGCSFYARCPFAGAPCRERKPQLEGKTIVGGGRTGEEGHVVACYFPLLAKAEEASPPSGRG
jgi:peptide/nickel transport system ATP-binding protein